MKYIKRIITLIFILGLGVILLSTIMPKLNSTHSRAPDTSRIADLNNINAGLITFYEDNGFFPGTNNIPECITSGDRGVGDSIKKYLEASLIPVDPKPNANTYLCNGTKKGKYWYSALSKDDINNQAFILCADMDSFQKANTDVGVGKTGDIADAPAARHSAATLMTTNYIELTTKVGAKTGVNQYTVEDPVNAGKSQYCILKP